MALIETPGAATANTYATLAEFETYIESRVPVLEWLLTATDDMKEAALIAACRILDSRIEWTGAAVDEVQVLTWPRSGMLTRNGYTIATTTIPQQLKDAQCELAAQLGASDLLSDNDAAKQGIASVKAGDVAVSFQNIDTSSEESVDMFIRRLGSEFAYLEVPGESRRLLVPSWFSQPSIKRPLEFNAWGGSNGAC